jgi:hypothetical protein
MPTLGVGILPAAGSIASELESVTRRAFMESVIVQIWKSSPATCAFLSNAMLASGGLNPITAPIQGNPMVTQQWTGYSGTFNQPGVTPGLQNAEFALAASVTAIPFLGFEGLVQLDYDVVPLIDARMNDATNGTIDQFSTAMYNNITNQQALIGLPAAIDDGTNASAYGGIARNSTNSLGNSYWQSTVVSNSGGAVTPTRNLFYQYVAQVTKKTGEKPKMGLVGFGTFAQLVEDFTAFERYNTGPGSNAYGDGGNVVNALFDALMIAGVPIYADPYCPEGELYLLNTDYLSLYIHEKAGFQFTGFESTLPNGQFGYVGAVLTLLQLVNVKPIVHGRFANLNYLPI